MSGLLAEWRGVSKRRTSRLEIKDLLYLRMPGDSVFLLNLSDGGMAVQAMDVLPPGQSIEFVLPLPKTGEEIRGIAKIVWSDSSGRAGLQFAAVPEPDLSRLQQWMDQQSN